MKRKNDFAVSAGCVLQKDINATVVVITLRS